MLPHQSRKTKACIGNGVYKEPLCQVAMSKGDIIYTDEVATAMSDARASVNGTEELGRMYVKGEADRF